MKTTHVLTASLLLAGLFLQGELFAQTLGSDAVGEEHFVEGVTPSSANLSAPEPAAVVGNSLVNRRATRDIREMVSEAEVVFRGTVEDIQYELSEPGGPEGGRVPYTFVTYWVDEVIHGQLDGNRATLRFLGGLNRENMRYMAASNAPQFDLGDEDILFVAGNGRKMCPLVGNQRGRLRVIADRIYTETGREVALGKSGKLEIGPQRALEEVLSTRVRSQFGTKEFRRRVNAETVDGPSQSMTPGELIRQIRTLGLQGGPGKAFANADPRGALLAPDMRPVPAPMMKGIEGRKPAGPERGMLERGEEVGPQRKLE